MLVAYLNVGASQHDASQHDSNTGVPIVTAGSSDRAIVAREIWIPGTFQRHVEAMVSPTQLTHVMQQRETWLRQNSLPMDYQIRDNVERVAFIQWAQGQFHEEDDQKKRQLQDYNEGGSKKVRKGKRSRWNRELQRRLGSTALWYMVHNVI